MLLLLLLLFLVLPLLFLLALLLFIVAAIVSGFTVGTVRWNAILDRQSPMFLAHLNIPGEFLCKVFSAQHPFACFGTEVCIFGIRVCGANSEGVAAFSIPPLVEKTVLLVPFLVLAFVCLVSTVLLVVLKLDTLALVPT